MKNEHGPTHAIRAGHLLCLAGQLLARHFSLDWIVRAQRRKQKGALKIFGEPP